MAAPISISQGQQQYLTLCCNADATDNAMQSAAAAVYRDYKASKGSYYNGFMNYYSYCRHLLRLKMFLLDSNLKNNAALNFHELISEINNYV